MIEINITIAVLGCLFYYLSLQSEGTEVFLYGIAATLFLIAAATGFLGYSDLIIGYTTSTSTLTGVATTSPIYANSTLFTKFIPFLELLISLYLYINLATFSRKSNS
jgi:hypothetical protein